MPTRLAAATPARSASPARSAAADDPALRRAAALLAGARRAATRRQATFEADLERPIRVDGRAVLVPDAALERALALVGRAAGPGALLRLEPGAEALVVRTAEAAVGACAVVALERIVLGGGRIRMELRTPGAAADQRAPAAVLGALLARLLGGTWGRRPLGAGADGLVTWDGDRGRVELPLERGARPRRLGEVEAIATVARNEGGLRLSFDRDGVAAELRDALVLRLAGWYWAEALTAGTVLARAGQGAPAPSSSTTYRRSMAFRIRRRLSPGSRPGARSTSAASPASASSLIASRNQRE